MFHVLAKRIPFEGGRRLGFFLNLRCHTERVTARVSIAYVLCPHGSCLGKSPPQTLALINCLRVVCSRLVFG